MKPLILLVEDNPLDLELMVEALERTGIAHPLYVVRDGEEALHILLEVPEPHGRNPAVVQASRNRNRNLFCGMQAATTARAFYFPSPYRRKCSSTCLSDELYVVWQALS